MKLRIKDIKVGDKLKSFYVTYLVTVKTASTVKVGDKYVDEKYLNTNRFQLLKKPKRITSRVSNAIDGEKPKTKKVEKWVPKDKYAIIDTCQTGSKNQKTLLTSKDMKDFMRLTKKVLCFLTQSTDGKEEK